MEQPLHLSVDEKGTIHIAIVGSLASEMEIGALSAALEVGTKVLIKQFQEQGKKVKVLIDITKFSGEYDARALEMMAKFAESNVTLVEKTASFGGGKKAQMAGELATQLSLRNNIKIFDTKEEAVAWLEA